MNKSFIIAATAVLVATSLTGCKKNTAETADGANTNDPQLTIEDQAKELEELRALAEMDRREMENQYEQFAMQYDELKKGVKDEKVIRELEAEKKHTQELLEQLRKLKKEKNVDASEILRLKKELESVREVLRSYIIQVDSLTRDNKRLRGELDGAHRRLDDATSTISTLNEDKARLNEKIDRAAQLNASGISISAVKKNGKSAKKLKEVNRFNVAFNIQRNVTASTGNRHIYVRIMTPSGNVLNPSGKFSYENKSLDCSASKTIEYTGEEQHVSLVVAASNDFLQPGRYSVHIFCDSQMIGSTSLTIEK